MEAGVVCQLFTIKEMISEPHIDIDSGIIKTEPSSDTDSADSMNSSRTESVDFDDFELPVEKLTHRKVILVSEHQLFPIRNESMEPAELDPLAITPEFIKRERIDVEDDDLSTGSVVLPIDTGVQMNAFMTKNNSHNEQVGKYHFSQVTTVTNEMQRIRKGKTRTTSYLVWSREMRQKLMSADPDRDYASITRELVKMWRNVTPREKFKLKRRAIRLNVQNGIDMSMKSTNKRKPSHGHGLVDESFSSENNAEFHSTNAEFHSTESTNYPMEQRTIAKETPLSNESSRKICRSVRKKSLKERNADLDMQRILKNPHISDDIKAILKGDLDNEMIQFNKRSKKIDDDDFMPTKKQRLERTKMIYGTRPRGRPRKLADCGTNTQTPKKKVKSLTKFSDKNRSLKDHSSNQTIKVDSVKQIKVEIN